MNILHIISGDIFAGAEMQVLQTILALKRSGLSVYCLLFNNGELHQQLVNNSIPTFIINEKNSSTFSIIIKAAKTIQNVKPDIIHVHRGKEHLVGIFSRLLTFRSSPLFRTVHGLTGKSTSNNLIKRFKWNFINRLESILLRYFTNRIIAVSNDMYTNIAQLNVNSLKITKIYNSIDIASINSIQQSSNDNTRTRFGNSSHFWVGTAARLVVVKNLSLFIDAANLLNISKPDTFKFSIFGDGPLRQDLQKRIDNHKLSTCFTLHGFEKHITPVISSFDLFLLCSNHEGLPMALLEAMALGIPVICTAVGGMKEIITHNTNGLLIPPNDPQALADAIITLYSDISFRKFIASNARKLIEESFSIDTNIEQLKTHYLSYNRR